MLEGDELEASGWGESGPDWDETFVETKRSLLLENAHKSITETIVCLLSGRLVHEQCSAFVEWRDGAGQEETGGEGSNELKEETFECERCDKELFASIITGHLGGVENHSSDNIGVEALVETSNAFGLHDFLSVCAEAFSF